MSFDKDSILTLNFERVRKEIFSYPMISPIRVTLLFRKMDNLLDRTLTEVARTTDWLDQAIDFLFGDIFGSVLSKYFIEPSHDQDEEWEDDILFADNPRKMYDSNTIEFMQAGMRKLKEYCFEQSSEIVNPKDLHLLREYRRDLLVELYETYGEKYCSAVWDLATLYNSALNSDSKVEVSKYLNRCAEHYETIHAIEKDLNTTESLYNMFIMIKMALDSFQNMSKRVICPYLKQALSIAQEHSGRDPDRTVRYIQAGAVGLTKAVLFYAPSRQRSFGTYSKWWVRQEILSEIKRGNFLVESQGDLWKRSKVFRARKANTSWTTGQVAQATKLSEEDVLRMDKLTEDLRPLSLEARDENGMSFLDTLTKREERKRPPLLPSIRKSFLAMSDGDVAMKVFAMHFELDALGGELTPQELIRLSVRQSVAARVHKRNNLVKDK